MSFYSVPANSPKEHKAVAELINNGLDSKEIYRAAYTFHRIKIEEELVKENNLKVQFGYFKDMLLHNESIGSSLLPKWQGTYETELISIIQTHSNSINSFVNIGCAEGYYLTGIARMLNINCYGTDIDKNFESIVKNIASKNNISNLVHYCYSIEDCIKNSSGSLLCLIDVEGSEIKVLNSLYEILKKNDNIDEIRLFIETDKNKDGSSNTDSIIESLINNNFKVLKIIEQNPSMRFVASQNNLSMLDQVVRGCEGRYADQSWIMACK